MKIRICYVPKMFFAWKIKCLNCSDWEHVKIYRWGWWHIGITQKKRRVDNSKFYIHQNSKNKRR